MHDTADGGADGDAATSRISGTVVWVDDTLGMVADECWIGGVSRMLAHAMHMPCTCLHAGRATCHGYRHKVQMPSLAGCCLMQPFELADLCISCCVGGTIARTGHEVMRRRLTRRRRSGRCTARTPRHRPGYCVRPVLAPMRIPRVAVQARSALSSCGCVMSHNACLVRATDRNTGHFQVMQRRGRANSRLSLGSTQHQLIDHRHTIHHADTRMINHSQTNSAALLSIISCDWRAVKAPASFR